MRRPGGVKHLEPRLNVFVANDVAQNKELASLRKIDDTAGRDFGRTKINPNGTTVGKVPVAFTARPRDSYPSERAKKAQVGEGGGAFAEKRNRRHVATGRLREAIANPIGRLDGEGVKIRA